MTKMSSLGIKHIHTHFSYSIDDFQPEIIIGYLPHFSLKSNPTQKV